MVVEIEVVFRSPLFYNCFHSLQFTIPSVTRTKYLMMVPVCTIGYANWILYKLQFKLKKLYGTSNVGESERPSLTNKYLTLFA